MKYLLDSETVSSFYNEADEHYEDINSKIMALSDDDEVYISVLTLYELEYGRANAPDDKVSKLRDQTQLAQSDFIILAVPLMGAELFGDLKKGLRDHWGLQGEDEAKQKNMKRHNIDLMLASTAIAQNAILISADKIYPQLAKITAQFQYENWILGKEETSNYGAQTPHNSSSF